MAKSIYERLVATSGIYGHMQRKGAGTPSSFDVINDSNNKVFNPGDNSFVYEIIPGASGVKFSAVEEDGIRLSAVKEGVTYASHQVLTGRFNRLAVETGDALIRIAKGADYYVIEPALIQPHMLQLVAEAEGEATIKIKFPSTYKMFLGEDIGFVLKIQKEDISLSDITIGDIHIMGDEDSLDELNAYGHANTELLATLADHIATYYIAKLNTNLTPATAHAALISTTDDSKSLSIELTLDEEGVYVITLQMVEMNENAGSLEVAGRVLSETTFGINVAEAPDETDDESDDETDDETDDESDDETDDESDDETDDESDDEE
jgi:hypothetical protein